MSSCAPSFPPSLFTPRPFSPPDHIGAQRGGAAYGRCAATTPSVLRSCVRSVQRRPHGEALRRGGRGGGHHRRPGWGREGRAPGAGGGATPDGVQEEPGATLLPPPSSFPPPSPATAATGPGDKEPLPPRTPETTAQRDSKETGHEDQSSQKGPPEDEDTGETLLP